MLLYLPSACLWVRHCTKHVILSSVLWSEGQCPYLQMKKPKWRKVLACYKCMVSKLSPTHLLPRTHTHTKSDLELLRWPGDPCGHKVRAPECRRSVWTQGQGAWVQQLWTPPSVAPSWSPGSCCRQHLYVSQNWHLSNVLWNMRFLSNLLSLFLFIFNLYQHYPRRYPWQPPLTWTALWSHCTSFRAGTRTSSSKPRSSNG